MIIAAAAMMMELQLCHISQQVLLKMLLWHC